jgi:hypothetical protein
MTKTRLEVEENKQLYVEHRKIRAINGKKKMPNVFIEGLYY